MVGEPKCPYCEADSLFVKSNEFRDKIPISIWQCSKCKVRFIECIDEVVDNDS